MRCTFIILISLLLLFSCNKYNDDSRYIKVTTDKGEIVIKLYNQTPKHRDNIIKLSEAKFYDGQIFHRIINKFVVQGGDPSTRKPLADTLYGNNDSGYLIDSEIIDSLIHKRGAIGMAREGDDINPEKKSSGSQFYFVQGKIFTNELLDELEKKKDSQRKANLYKELLLEKISSQKKLNNIDTVSIALDVSMVIDSIYDSSPKFKFSEIQRNVYTKLGGIPHLDGNYTVFGEIVKGMDVVDQLSSVQTDLNDRPLKDIKFSISVLK